VFRKSIILGGYMEKPTLITIEYVRWLNKQTIEMDLAGKTTEEIKEKLTKDFTAEEKEQIKDIMRADEVVINDIMVWAKNKEKNT
jgi:hypothetical protein